ncbi:glutathione-dependent formaldehyde-activating enzyme [Coniochaeta ligniaria NRRL 30616]|uniref:Glutathione-dependent formaldehyde-activating enzyme n=1 Tax=Coniochaeta ligniaria NRRL 30616 TaxID=1408157 RepID=A0A1J7JEI8_9PEZI|nr:glutathione-dependent formaldehyde-activating enzyme [Coniochaeta ligniaria NRRL 30616]
MAETESLKSYRGNCHCGAFVFELKVPEIKVASECNCSICKKKGYLFTFPGDGMTVVKGEGSLKEYTFSEGNTKHRFCPTCGTPVMGYNAKFPPGMNNAINVRTIQDLDIWKLETKPFDGKGLGAPYTPPAYSGPEPSAEIEGAELYTGSCHCGAVTACLKTKPLDSTYPDPIVECSCSNCQRAAYIWIYPKKDQIVIQGRENLSYYVFGTGGWRKGFCKTCGVQIMNEPNTLTPEQVEALPAAARAWRDEKLDSLPTTIRILNDFEFDAVKDKVARFDGWNMGAGYVNP